MKRYEDVMSPGTHDPDVDHEKHFPSNSPGTYESRLRAKKKQKSFLNTMQDTIRDLKQNAFGIGKGADSSVRYH